MTAAVERIAREVQQLDRAQIDEFLAWLADHELARLDDWDKEIERDSKPGGRLDAVLTRVRDDIAQGRTRPLDAVLDHA